MLNSKGKLIIGICGFSGSGKNTFADFLIERYGFKPFSFASALKDILSTLFDWDRRLLEGDTEESRKWRETPDEYWSSLFCDGEVKIENGFTPRKAMQKIGTDLFRNHFNENFWALSLKNKILKSSHDKIVITDFRFENEFKIFQESFDFFYVFNIIRWLPANSDWYLTLTKKVKTISEYEDFKKSMLLLSDSKTEATSSSSYKHQSEYEWIWVLKTLENLKFFKIYNTQETLEDFHLLLEDKICEICENFKRIKTEETATHHPLVEAFKMSP